MKKILIALAVLALASVAFGEAQDAASRERSRILSDPDYHGQTNHTTALTTVVSAGAGQLLVGKAGGTNRVYISTAAGTNSWKQIATD